MDTKPVLAAVTETSSEITKLREELVQSCLAFDRSAAEQTLARAFAFFPPEVVWMDLMQSGLAAIGALWYEGKMNVKMAGIIAAALRFGVDEILGRKIAWYEHLVKSCRISEE